MTSAPASISCPSTSAVSLAGPMVATIFVRPVISACLSHNGTADHPPRLAGTTRTDRRRGRSRARPRGTRAGPAPRRVSRIRTSRRDLLEPDDTRHGRPQRRWRSCWRWTSGSRPGWPNGTRTAPSTSPSRNSRPPTIRAGTRCSPASGRRTSPRRSSGHECSTRSRPSSTNIGARRSRSCAMAGSSTATSRTSSASSRVRTRLLLPQLHLDQPRRRCIQRRTVDRHRQRDQPSAWHRPPDGPVPARLNDDRTT